MTFLQKGQPQFPFYSKTTPEVGRSKLQLSLSESARNGLDPEVSPENRAARLSLRQDAMEAVKKFAVDGVMGVVTHPFVPYMLVLMALLRSL